MSDNPPIPDIDPQTVIHDETSAGSGLEKVLRRLIGPRVQVDLEEWRNAYTSRNEPKDG